jgi:hypothetical protein
LWRASLVGRGGWRGSYASSLTRSSIALTTSSLEIDIAFSAGSNNAGFRLRNSEIGSWIDLMQAA